MKMIMLFYVLSTCRNSYCHTIRFLDFDQKYDSLVELFVVKLLSGKFINIPKRPGETDWTFADIGKITELTKWRPKISFEVGVKKILNHIYDFKQAPLWNEKTIAEETKDWFKYLKNNSYLQIMNVILLDKTKKFEFGKIIFIFLFSFFFKRFVFSNVIR